MDLKFGTDGVRDIYGARLEEAAYNLGRAMRGDVVLGRDTRTSGEALSRAFIQGASDAGARVLQAGIMPTAGVAYLTQKAGAQFGVVISASHNPPEYNGLKVFSSEGAKVSDEEESRLGAALKVQNVRKNSPCRVIEYERAREEYIDFLCSAGENLSGCNIALDCSNGAASVIAPEVFCRLGANVEAISVGTSGADINEGCGALHADTLVRRVPSGFDLALAFDGDSDRLIAADREGNILDGDRIMYIIAALTMQKGVKTDCVVGTVLSNGGTQEAFEKMGIEFLRADVGDKYVKMLMDASGAKIGGEQSGHIILSDYAQTGDGILTAVVLATLLKGKRAADYDYPVYPQPEVSLKVRDKGSARAEAVQAVAEEWRKRGVRVLVRPSGTEPKVRVMTECADAEKAERAMEEIIRALKSADM